MTTTNKDHGFPTMPNEWKLIEHRLLPRPFNNVGWRVWHRIGNPNNISLRTFVHTFDCHTGQPMTQYSGRTKATPSTIQTSIRDELITAIKHEVDESLTFGGVRPFCPHAKHRQPAQGEASEGST